MPSQVSTGKKSSKPKTINAVRPNEGIRLAYQKKLDDLIAEMQASLVYWLRASYRRNEPVALAMDKTPAKALDDAWKVLAKRWQLRLNQLAPVLARYFAKAASDRSDAGLKAAMRKAGLTVKFTMTAAQRDAVDAVVAENVGLIKSIAAQHLQDVQGILMRSVTRGRDLGGMTKELEARYGITRRRAALIARDQNNKATAVIVRTRQRELGITEAIWVHSSAGRHPRPSHVEADGKRYEVAKGMKIDGEFILPGELINCRCLSRAIIPGLS